MLATPLGGRRVPCRRCGAAATRERPQAIRESKFSLCQQWFFSVYSISFSGPFLGPYSYKFSKKVIWLLTSCRLTCVPLACLREHRRLLGASKRPSSHAGSWLSTRRHVEVSAGSRCWGCWGGSGSTGIPVGGVRESRDARALARAISPVVPRSSSWSAPRWSFAARRTWLAAPRMGPI